MVNISVYRDNVDEDWTSEAAFQVNSAGHYRLIRREQFHTDRPAGRRDWQLLYVEQGTLYYQLNGQTLRAGPGQALLYWPGAGQHYWYYAKDRPHIYWLHFAGTGAGALAALCAGPGRPAFTAGEGHARLFEGIISEMQAGRPHGGEMAALLARQLLLAMARALAEGEVTPAQSDMQKMIERLHREYAAPRPVAEYAAALGMSTCWFIRQFRRHTGFTPLQFTVHLRMQKAREMLDSTHFRVREVAAMVGYEDPLYFSRMFQAATGLSPSAYRRAGGK